MSAEYLPGQDEAQPEVQPGNAERPVEVAATNFYIAEQNGVAAQNGPKQSDSSLKAIGKKRPRSDSDLSDIAEEDAGSDFDAEEQQSDDSLDRYFTPSMITGLVPVAINARLAIVYETQSPELQN